MLNRGKIVDKSLKSSNLRAFSRGRWRFYPLGEVPIRNVMVKLDALGAAKPGENLHDLLLLFGRERVLAVVNAIIWAVSPSE